MNLTRFMTVLAEGEATTEQTGNTTIAMLGTFLPLILIVVLMYFVMIRPQRKQQKKEQQMRNSLRVGDEITTIGGITGRVVNLKEDTLVIETGADRNKMTIKKWAIQSCETIHDTTESDDDDDDDDDI